MLHHKNAKAGARDHPCRKLGSWVGRYRHVSLIASRGSAKRSEMAPKLIELEQLTLSDLDLTQTPLRSKGHDPWVVFVSLGAHTWIMSFVRTLVILLALPSILQAEREVHVVSLANGSRDPINLMSIDDAHVHVDRPGQSVVLVLLDRGPLTWHVSYEPDTIIEGVILGGDNPDQSDVYLSTIRFEGAEIEGLPVPLQPQGALFRQMVATVSARANTDGISGFYGAYDAPFDRIVLRDAGSSSAYKIDYLDELVSTKADIGLSWTNAAWSC